MLVGSNGALASHKHKYKYYALLYCIGCGTGVDSTFETCLQVSRAGPKRHQEPKKEKSGFAILCGALLHLLVLLGAAWGSWSSQHSMPIMPLYHQDISYDLDTTG